MTETEFFTTAFRTLTGHAPFHWQARLFTESFVVGDVPSFCDIPTGLGKTSVMALWLIALANRAPLPRRLAYVVDRRAVVDQATRFAEQLRAGAASAVGITDLPISTLRGQFADNRLWLEDPSGPAIIVGTIDMMGSRLLFEGYGVSRRMRPYQAGMLGADTLFILDEAHLCPPFESLLRTIATDDSLKPIGDLRRAILPKFHLMSLSATGRTECNGGFRLGAEDKDPEAQPVVHGRITARKRLELIDLAQDEKLDNALANRARQLGEGNKRVVVFSHSHEIAQKVEAALNGPAMEKHRPDTELLVGARRVRERQALANWLQAQGFSPPPPGDDPPPPRDRPAFLVATAAGEVGIDFDADHMVSDLVAYERMVQRLGRVNRRGGEGREAIVEVFCAPPKPPKADATEDAKQKCQEQLDLFQARRAALAALRNAGDGRQDASPEAFAELKAKRPALVERATTPAPLHPALNRAVVDAWSLTSLREHPGRPEPGPWLRGWTDDEGPQTEVIWRRWLPWRKDAASPSRAEIEAYFETALPHLNEILATDTWRVLEWLISRTKNLVHSKKEHPEAPERLPETKEGIIVLSPAREFRHAMAADALASLSDKAKKQQKDHLERLLANATVVVSASLGGLGKNGLLDKDESEPPLCLDDGWTDAELTDIGFRVLGPGAAPSTGWHEALTFPLIDSEDHAPDLITVAVLRTKRTSHAGDPAISKMAQSLAEHTEWVASEVKRLARALDLDCEYQKMLLDAASVHDGGKSRELWQNAMRAPRTGRPYAKTTAKGNPALLKIGDFTYRHEFGSLADAETDPAILALPDDLRDLALHLIAAHHGHARPTIAPADPEKPPSLSEPRAREAALRFARLQRQWGPWGLAWWEAILRAADQRASRRLT